MKSSNRNSFLLLMPAVLALVIFFVFPLGKVLVTSIFDPDFTLKHYAYFFSERLYTRITFITIEIAALATICSVIAGYPVAYVLRRSGPKIRNIFFIAIVLSFIISLLVRNYSWIIVLQRNGAINSLLQALSIISEPLKLMHNKTGVIIGMTHIFIPYIIFPVYSVMASSDLNLEKAAMNLGAGKWQTFYRVTLPLSLPGVGAGALLVFIMALGFFITPALLGGRKEQMLSNLIQIQVIDLLNWPFASAMSVILLIVTLVIFFIYQRYLGVERLFSGNIT